MAEHPRTALNNWSARTGKNIFYQEQRFGPQHAEVWIVKVYVDGEQYGAGQATRKETAKEAAAIQAVNVLRNYGHQV
ncbi:hypothetical protein BT96DRAFT_913406 [Gymnopus androsaceus JB14]|uniref:DRBM domain-containing protein n=1 Tax=Gymnopus androsaceus JB14 TaxID=1447944 RepID=A0A6A4IF30_9AGAR|nr:hypothetical protein BT96DRAFT_913406 [Gymnopus androsaceus JB14]